MRASGAAMIMPRHAEHARRRYAPRRETVSAIDHGL